MERTEDRGQKTENRNQRAMMVVSVLCLLSSVLYSLAQPARPTPGQASSANEINMVKHVIAARREYQQSLE
jgi:hypothetical protein